MNARLRTLLRRLPDLDLDRVPRTPDGPCPTWAELSAALAAASRAADPLPNGRPVARALAAPSAVADALARTETETDPNA